MSEMLNYATSNNLFIPLVSGFHGFTIKSGECYVLSPMKDVVRTPIF